MRQFKKSRKLDHVCYDIRGPVMNEARRMEEAGESIIKLNIGNPAPFGFEAPADILATMSEHLHRAHGYSDSRGLLEARQAILDYHRGRGIAGIDLNDIYLGNGVSELIMMSMQALLDSGDEVLIPAPDYPLWTAAVNLAGGTAVHYRCDEQSDWNPDLRDLRAKITPATKGLVLINPNNPTGAVYPREVLQAIINLAVEHQLIVFADEIYDKILYDGATHHSAASMSDETLFITLNGLSKSHRIAGFRAGWMVISGNRTIARDYLEGLNMLSSMRLCSNVPAQYAVKIALEGHQSIADLIRPGGRLEVQRDFAWQRINQIPGLSCVKPKGALYLFPRIDPGKFHFDDDQRLVLDLLKQEQVLLVQGTGFNWPEPDHVRIVFLPGIDQLRLALERVEHFLSSYNQRQAVDGDGLKRVI